jgi:hypothetical protein
MLDTNIDNYNLQKLLDLFEVDAQFDESDLKQAKRKVLKLHPDKSGLDNEVFIFFINAYKKLECIFAYNQKAKSESELQISMDVDTKLKNYLDSKNINSFENQEAFLKEFNRMFDEVYIRDNENGHEEWLKSDENLYDKDDIERSRNQIVMKRETIEESDHSSLSNHSYFDVKEAYTKSIFDIDVNHEMKNKRQYGSVDEYKRQRQNQNINPIALDQSKQYLKNKESYLKNDAMNMAYEILEKQERMEKRMNDYASRYLLLDEK